MVAAEGFSSAGGISGRNVVGGQGDELLRPVNGQEPFLPDCPLKIYCLSPPFLVSNGEDFFPLSVLILLTLGLF